MRASRCDIQKARFARHRGEGYRRNSDAEFFTVIGAGGQATPGCSKHGFPDDRHTLYSRPGGRQAYSMTGRAGSGSHGAFRQTATEIYIYKYLFLYI